jgi:hypothetical protein
MAIATISKNLIKKREIKQLQIKAALFDELIIFLEDKFLGYLMESVEKERNLSISRAKRMMRK